MASPAHIGSLLDKNH